MSMYTTKVLDILRNYTLPETNQTFDELIDDTYQDYFNFDFPWYTDDQNSKIEFEKLFLLHFLMYEIGQETIELHRSRVAQRLRLIMPEIQQIWDSLNIDIPWLQNVDMAYTGEGNENQHGNTERSVGSTIDGTSHDESTSSSTANSQTIDSDNPQINFSGTDYASQMSRGQTEQSVNNENDSATKTTETRSEGEEKTNTSQRTETRTEKGNRGMSRGDIVRQMRDAVYNVNQEIINRCEDLFMLVY